MLHNGVFHSFSYVFSMKCFFGYDTCDHVPGLRGSMFVFMYLLAYIGNGFLLRYAEGATYLAVVQVITLLTIKHMTVFASVDIL